MSPRSGEMARRAALGIGKARNGADVAREVQTIRYSVLDRAKSQIAKRGKLASQRADAGRLMWALNHEVSRLRGERQEIINRLEKLPKSREVEVSDHAVVRFLERALQIDVQAIRDQIARLIPPDVIEPDRTLYVRGDLQFLLSDHHLITVLSRHMDAGVEKAFQIDDKPIGGADVKAANTTDDRVKRAARVLSLHAKSAQKARQDAMTSRLKAEMGIAA